MTNEVHIFDAEKLSFQSWFEQSGNDLLGSWLRAQQDGNTEPFADWVSGEYDCYLEDGDGYEIPYRGIFDQPAIYELLIFQDVKT